jgi:nicotinamide-nucleotide amidase
MLSTVASSNISVDVDDGSSTARLAERVVDTCSVKNTKIITAESCTAGSLATLLADTPGSGLIFLGGFVTYSKVCKTDVLGIPSDILIRETAVSAPVAAAMTEGALSRCLSADIAVAITCVAGPEPDEDGNPVGLTFVGVQQRGKPPVVQRHVLDGTSPDGVRRKVIMRALHLLLEHIELRNGEGDRAEGSGCM